MRELRSFWPFYGGKWRIAPRYPEPLHETIVEPFAGAAGYATRYADRRVVLVERDPIIAALWRYLIRVTPAEVRTLPLVVEDVRDLPVCTEAQNLIAWWLNKGTSTPHRRASSWVRNGWRPKSSWGPEVRERIASQVESIRHWRVIEGDYYEAPPSRRRGLWIRPTRTTRASATDTARASSVSTTYPRGVARCLARRSSARASAQRGCRSGRSPTSTAHVGGIGPTVALKPCGSRSRAIPFPT